MLTDFLRAILHKPFLVVLGTCVLLFSGVTAWKNLPIDAFPDVTNVQVMILTQGQGLTPDEMERLVTVPIETEMGGLPGVTSVRSLSKSGLSQVIVVFDDDTDTYFTRQLVLERLVSAREALPLGFEPELGPISTGLGEIYQYVVEPGYYCQAHPREWSDSPGECGVCKAALLRSEHTQMDLRTIQDWIIAPQLRRIRGVNEVNSFGGFVKQYHVIPEQEKLLKYALSLREVVEALENNNSNAGGGYLVKDWEQSYLVSRGLLRDETDIAQIVLKAEQGTTVLMSDVAQVSLGGQERQGAVTKDGKGEVVAGMVIMLKGANSKTVVDRVRAEIPEINKSLPPGVRINPFYDRTELIQACIRTVSKALLEGSVFVVLVLFLFLANIRAALTVAFSLPLTASFTFILMGWQGVTANLMSLGGLSIAIGMVADGAIVVTENIVRHMEDSTHKGQARAQVAFWALLEVLKPVFFAICIIIIVFLPLFTLESLEGKMFKPLAQAMCFAMIGSLVVSLTIVPVLASLLVSRHREGKGEHFVLRVLNGIYNPVLNLAMRGGWNTVAIAAAIMVATFALIPKLGTEFLPALDEGAIAINVVRLPSAGLEGSRSQASFMEQQLREAFPTEIQTVVSKTGRAEIAEDPMGPEQNDLIITLKPREEWKVVKTKEELVQAIGLELSKVPGIRPAFSQPIALRVNELISGIKSDVAIKIFGDDLVKLQSIAQEVAPIVSEIEGAEDVKIEQVTGFAQLEVSMDRKAMGRHGINVADVNEIVETAVGGKVATYIYEAQRRFAVLVRFPESQRRSLAELEKLLVNSPAGYQVQLGELVKIDEVDAPATISRENSRRRMLVECNIRDRDIGSFIAEAKEKLAGVESSLPESYRIVWGGQFENQQRAMARLKVVVPVTMLLVFVLLFIALNSVKSAILVFLNLPFAVVGGILALYLFHINMSVAASVGFIALLGVSVLDGLLMVSFVDDLRKDGLSVREAILRARQLRLRPLLMTTSVTVLGLLPMLYATGSGSEIQKPLVAVMFGGLITSLGLTLIILPVLYTLVCSDRRASDRGLDEGGR